MDRRHIICSVLILLGLGIWGWFSYLYRFDRLYGDSAAYLFRIVNDSAFFIAHQRPSGLFIQVLPIILLKFAAGMDLIIASLSINEFLVILFFTGIAVLLLKDFFLGLCILLPQFFGMMWNYFNPVSELILASPLLFALTGMMVKYQKNTAVLITAAAGSIFLIYCHPLYFFILPVCFTLLYLMKQVNQGVLIACLISAAAAIVVKYLSLGDYDKGQFKGGDVQTQLLDHDFSYIYHRIVFELQTLYKHYIGFIVIFIFNFFIFLKTGKWKAAVVSLGFLISYFAYVMVKFDYLLPHTYEPFERYLFPAVIVNAFTFYLNKDQINIFMLLTIGALFIYHASDIYNYGTARKVRNEQVRYLIEYGQNHQMSKIIARYENMNPVHLGHDWIITNESLLLSGMTGNEKTVQIALTYDSKELTKADSNQFIYYPPSWFEHVNELNPMYFSLKKENYSEINTDTLIPEEQEFYDNLECVLNESPVFKAGRENFKRITIKNNNPTPLPTGIRGSKSIRLGVEWKNPDHGWGTGEFQLLADVADTMKQYFIFMPPMEKGIFKMRFYMKNGSDKVFYVSDPIDAELK